MGRRGPAPTPTDVKIRRGETRPSRLNDREPKPRRVAPTMPRGLEGLDDTEKAVWVRALREMPSGVIRAADTDILRMYCETVALRQRALRAVKDSGLLIRRDGNLVKNPLLQVVRDNGDALRLLARELGLTPAARAGMQLEMGAGAGAADDMDAELGPSPRQLRVVGGNG